MCVLQHVFSYVTLINKHVFVGCSLWYASLIFLYHFDADHVGCLRERGVALVDKHSKGRWFCSKECRKVTPCAVLDCIVELRQKLLVLTKTRFHLTCNLCSLKGG